jgi:hypothetical protein
MSWILATPECRYSLQPELFFMDLEGLVVLIALLLAQTV